MDLSNLMQQLGGDFNDVVKRYTNKTFLIEDHGATLRSHENLPIGQNDFQMTTTTTPNMKSSPLCSLHVKNCINLTDILKSIDEPVAGKFLLCRSLCPPIKMTALFTIVDDPAGKLGARISLYNFVRNVAHRRPKDVYQYLPVGTILAIMNPWFEKSAGGGLTIRCDNPAEVVILSQSMVKEIFGSLTWNGEIPMKYRPNELLADDSAVNTNWKAAGNVFFTQKRFRDAIQAYSNGINAEAKESFSENRLNLLANRSAAYLALRNYDLALVDAESVLLVDNNHIKCIFRKAKALFGQAEYQKALDFLADVSLDTLPIEQQKVVTDLIVKGKSLILQSQTGKYPWIEIFDNKFDELAEFVGPVIVKNTQTKGRGLFATTPIKAGQLILASKAFARVVDNSSNNFFVSMSSNLKLKDRVQTQLITEVAHILKDNPKRCQEVYNLYGGPEFGDRKVPVEAHGSDVDMKRIESICFYNQFGNGGFGMTSDGNERDCGLWLSPSFINHSCVDANSSWFTKGDFLFVLAFHNIVKDEEILIGYMPPLEKATQLLESRGFVCDCRLCNRNRQDSSAIRSKRSDLINRLDGILKKYEDEGFINYDIYRDDAEMTAILKLLNDLRKDAPELNLFYADRMEILADLYFRNGQTLKSLTTLENVYSVVAHIPVLCRLTVNINNNIVEACILLGELNKAKKWIRVLKRNCALTYGTWEVLELEFPFTYKTIQELGIDLNEM